MANTDDTSKAQSARTPSNVSAETSTLEQAIEAERMRLLQVHSVLHCLYEVLLYAEGEEAVTYADAAHLAAMMIDEVVAQLDTVRLRPMIEAIKRSPSPQDRHYPMKEGGLKLGTDDDEGVKEPRAQFYYRH